MAPLPLEVGEKWKNDAASLSRPGGRVSSTGAKNGGMRYDKGCASEDLIAVCAPTRPDE
jgi:hypothetical protein